MSDTTSLLELPTRRQLHRVAFEGEDTAHWALFLPFRAGDHRGKLCHVGVEKGRSGKKIQHRLQWSEFAVGSSSAQSVFPIPGAVITESQLRMAAESVFDRKGYRAITNNCQHFCIDVVTELNRNWPDSVPSQAVADIQARGTKFTKLTTFLSRSRLRLQRPTPMPAAMPQEPGPRFSID